jgi:hypothetical protein
MQRCSISAVCGYSAWSMKLRWRFSAMILSLGLHPRRHEGREVAHGNAVGHELFADQPHGIDGAHAVLRQLVVGGRLEQEAVAILLGQGI